MAKTSPPPPPESAANRPSGNVTVQRVRRHKGHESISRDSLQNRALSFKARGIMAYLESMPDCWEVNGAQGIANASDRDGYSAVNEGIKELEAAGLFARLKRQGELGRWEWLWVHSDDPRDVSEAVAEWTSSSERRLSPQSGPRTSQPPRSGDLAEDTAGQGIEGAADPMLRFSVHGESVGGGAVHGEPRNKEVYSEIYSEKNPGGDLVDAGASARPPEPAPPPNVSDPDPPKPVYDASNPRCQEHRGVRAGERGPNCAACARVREWQTAKETEAAATQARALRDCPMCDAEGTRVDERRVPLTPYRRCDHVTATNAVLQEIAAADEAARVPRKPAEHVPSSSADARKRALASARSKPSQNNPGSNTRSDFRNCQGSGHNGGVRARTG